MNQEIRFRKKPVVINAVQYTRRFGWPDWFHDAVTRNDIVVFGTGKWASPVEPCYCTIKTLEGVMRADEGDWIIQGVKGEIYPCKPDIFEATYEPEASPAAQPVDAPDIRNAALDEAAEAMLPMLRDMISRGDAASTIRALKDQPPKEVRNELDAANETIRKLRREKFDLESKMRRHALPDVGEMVNRFLGWKLPADFHPDCGISFDGRKDDEWNKNKTWPIGTNLLTQEQAKAMFLYCLGSEAQAQRNPWAEMRQAIPPEVDAGFDAAMGLGQQAAQPVAWRFRTFDLEEQAHSEVWQLTSDATVMLYHKRRSAIVEPLHVGSVEQDVQPVNGGNDE